MTITVASYGILLVGLLVTSYSVLGDYLDDVCLQRVDEGTDCDKSTGEGPGGDFVAFSYASEQCVHFKYKGCGGNKNRFKKMDNCLTACTVAYWQRRNKKKAPHGVTDINKEKTQTPEGCFEPKDAGICEAKKTVWYFDTASSTCQSFQFNGCNGNGNRFASEAICKQVCIGKKKYYISPDNGPE